MNTETINDIKVKPIIIANKYTRENVRGFDYFQNPYANISIISKKGGGKSTLIYNILRKCCSKKTVVKIFCSTINMDDTYKKLREMLEKKGVECTLQENFIDQDTKQDYILDFLKEQNALSDPKDSESSDTLVVPKCNFGDTICSEEESKKERIDPLMTPKFIFIFDDLGSDLRHPSINKLLIKNRHYLLKTIISHHDITNLMPASIRNLNNVLILPAQSEDKIDQLAMTLGINFKKDTRKKKFLNDLYEFATSKPYNFLYIDRDTNEFRKNFNELIKY